MEEVRELTRIIDRWAQRRASGNAISVEAFAQQLVNDGWSKKRRIDVKVSLQPNEVDKLQERIDRVVAKYSAEVMSETEITKKVCKELIDCLESGKQDAREQMDNNASDRQYYEAMYYMQKLNVLAELKDLVKLFAKGKGVMEYEIEN